MNDKWIQYQENTLITILISSKGKVRIESKQKTVYIEEAFPLHKDVGIARLWGNWLIECRSNGIYLLENPLGKQDDMIQITFCDANGKLDIQTSEKYTFESVAKISLSSKSGVVSLRESSESIMSDSRTRSRELENLSGERPYHDIRQQLKQQLEHQAAWIGAESDNVELVSALLTTCSVIFDTVNKVLPESLTSEEFDNVCAGHLTIANGIKQFYEVHIKNMNQKMGFKLKSLVEMMQNAEEQKALLETQLLNIDMDNNELQGDIAEKQDILKQKNKIFNQNEEKKSKLEDELETMIEKIGALEDDQSRIQSQIDSFETDVDRMIQEVQSIQGTYDEMMAYYSELDRIQNGFKEDGYVNMSSFSEALHEMNLQGEELLRQYDQILKKVSLDIEALQNEIELRRKAGAIS